MENFTDQQVEDLWLSVSEVDFEDWYDPSIYSILRLGGISGRITHSDQKNLFSLSKCKVDDDSTSEERLSEVPKVFNFHRELVKCNLNFRADTCPEEILKLMEDRVDGLCEDTCLWIINGDEKVTEVKDMVNTKSPLRQLDDCLLLHALLELNRLLCRTESFCHPLFRKSYREEFFSIVDAAEKLEERKLVMRFWRGLLPSWNKRKMLCYYRAFVKLSRAEGLRDKRYMYYCYQIQLQECLDCHLHYSRNLKHDSLIQNLMIDEAVVPKKFKQNLDLELIRLSLQAFIDSDIRAEQQRRAYMQLQLLEDARRKNETGDVDKMLIDLCYEFPWILNFPPCIDNSSKEDLFNDALEKRFLDVVHKIKEVWFPYILDHYVVEVILLYIKHRVSKSEPEPEESWPTECFQRSKFYKIYPSNICHEHEMYNYVMDVELKLP